MTVTEVLLLTGDGLQAVRARSDDEGTRVLDWFVMRVLAPQLNLISADSKRQTQWRFARGDVELLVNSFLFSTFAFSSLLFITNTPLQSARAQRLSISLPGVTWPPGLLRHGRSDGCFHTDRTCPDANIRVHEPISDQHKSLDLAYQ